MRTADLLSWTAQWFALPASSLERIVKSYTADTSYRVLACWTLLAEYRPRELGTPLRWVPRAVACLIDLTFHGRCKRQNFDFRN